MKRTTGKILFASGIVCGLCAFGLFATGLVFSFRSAALQKNNEEWKETTEFALAENGVNNETVNALLQETYQQKQETAETEGKIAAAAGLAGCTFLAAAYPFCSEGKRASKGETEQVAEMYL